LAGKVTQKDTKINHLKTVPDRMWRSANRRQNHLRDHRQLILLGSNSTSCDFVVPARWQLELSEPRPETAVLPMLHRPRIARSPISAADDAV
jgi:hypothetical protein